MLPNEAELTQSGGSNLSLSSPVFTTNSKYICVCCGYSVKVISTASGELVQQLDGHTDVVTCVQGHPNNVLQVFTSSKDKTIKQWDFQDGVILKSYDINCHLKSFFPLPTVPDTLVALTDSTNNPNTSGSEVKILNLRKGNEQTLLSGVINSCSALSLGCNGTLLTAIYRAEVVVHCLKNEIQKSHKLKKSKRAYFTCVLCHPTEECVVTGSSTGKIHVWRNVLADDVIMTIYHWHHFAVSCLDFTADGSYLLSGGAECVLVKWQFGTDTKDFLPRLEAPINFIAVSPDNTMYAITHTDNAIQLVTSNFQLLSQFQGLTRNFLSHRQRDPFPTGMLVDPKTGALVLTGRPGHLQFYDLKNDKQLYNLDITGENYIVATEIGGQESCTGVVRAAFDKHGDILATVEVWDDGVMSPEMRLKFWHDTEAEGSFVLNTCVELPHNQPINSIEFRPTRTPIGTNLDAMLVTTSDDGKFKLWQLVDDTDMHRENLKWCCESVGFYRDLTATCSSFSQDGSLLSVVFNGNITLWDPDTNALKTSLTLNPTEPVTHLKFGNNKCSHYLVSATSSLLAVWNCLKCTVAWTVPLCTSLLLCDSNTNIFAVVSNEETLYVFQPSSSDLIYVHKNAGDIVSGIFIHDSQTKSDIDWQHGSQLYLMTRTQDLLTFSDITPSKTSQHMDIAEENLPVAPMSLFLGHERRSAVDKQAYMTEVSTTGSPSDMFSCPSHVLPPTSKLCSAFLKQLLKLNINSTGTEDENVDENDDEGDIVTQDESVDSDIEDISTSYVDNSGAHNHTSDHRNISHTDNNSSITNIVSQIDYQSEFKTEPFTKKQLKQIRKLKNINYDWLFNK